MLEYPVQTQHHTQFLNIDSTLRHAIKDTGLIDGSIQFFVPHTTAGITINENADPDVTADMEKILERAVPWEGGYKHAEGNSAAHVKASMMGFSATVFVENGQPCFGTWQSLYFCEFDGPRHRKIWVRPNHA